MSVSVFSGLSKSTSVSRTASISELDGVSDNSGDSALSPFNILIVGQSNGSKLTSDYSGAGETALKAALSSYYSTVTVVNAAVPSSAVDERANEGFGYWWDVTGAGSAGALATDAVADVTAASIAAADLHAIVYVNGETDSVNISDSTITEANFKASFLALINYFKTQYPNAKHFIVPMGIDTTSSTNDVGGTAVRRASLELVASESGLYEVPSHIAATHSDDIHLDSAGYTTLGTLIGNRIAGVEGKRSTTGTLGPITSAVTADATNNIFTCDITHDGGTDFFATAISDLDNAAMFAAEVNGTTIYEASTVSRVDTNTYQFRLGSHSILETNTYKVLYPWGHGHGATIAQVVVDNNGLPLRPKYGLSASVTGTAPSTLESIFPGKVVYEIDINTSGCFDGVQTLSNLSASIAADGVAKADYNFTLGASTAVTTDDPTITNAGTTTGQISFDGGDFLNCAVSSSGGSVIKNLHKTGATGFVVLNYPVYVPSLSAAARLAGTSRASTQHGFLLNLETNGSVTFNHHNGTTAATTTILPAGSIVAGNTYFISIKIDRNTKAFAVGLNSRAFTTNTGTLTYNTTTTDSPANYRIGASNNTSALFLNGTLTYHGSALYHASVDFTDTDLNAIINYANNKRSVTYA